MTEHEFAKTMNTSILITNLREKFCLISEIQAIIRFHLSSGVNIKETWNSP